MVYIEVMSSLLSFEIKRQWPVAYRVDKNGKLELTRNELPKKYRDNLFFLVSNSPITTEPFRERMKPNILHFLSGLGVQCVYGFFCLPEGMKTFSKVISQIVSDLDPLFDVNVRYDLGDYPVVVVRN